ncbi:N [blacklegged tick virus 3]|uniref:Nucleoprotein n=1 Tax=blacklegged tick virus 3 TaxID=1844920 RepID=A0A172MHV7_9VIRU|nr:N [Blacklegged tick phlebovirus 3] [Blacklegged tick phlebovirus 3]ANC97696.1 N [Blacklegged tick phlebovirus 3] [Blacklegged tick phlebovirus 3]
MMTQVKTEEGLTKALSATMEKAEAAIIDTNFVSARTYLTYVQDCHDIWVKRGNPSVPDINVWLANTRILIPEETSSDEEGAEVVEVPPAPARVATPKRKAMDQDQEAGPSGVPPQKRAATLEEVLRVLEIAPETPPGPDEVNWRQALDTLDMEGKNIHVLQELVQLFQFRGFNAGKLAKHIMGKEPCGYFKKVVGGVATPDKTMDILAMVIIGMSRGSKIEKIRKGLSEDGLTAVNSLITAYGVVSTTRESLGVTFPRVVAVFPSVAMDIAAQLTMGPVALMTMNSRSPGYPRCLMCSGLPSLIPTTTAEYAEVVLNAYLLYQLEVSLILNPDFKKQSREEQKRTVEGFARAAMQSSYCSEEQRIRQMLKHELVQVEVTGLRAPDTNLGRALLNAAAEYRRY